MNTRNVLERLPTERLLGAVANRPAGPGLMLVVGLLAVAISGWTVTSAAWFWPTCAVVVVLAVAVNAVCQDVRRRVQTRHHKQRMDTANALLNDHLAFVEPEKKITGSIRELGGLVERFGQKLDELLTEVHSEKSSADQRPHRS